MALRAAACAAGADRSRCHHGCHHDGCHHRRGAADVSGALAPDLVLEPRRTLTMVDAQADGGTEVTTFCFARRLVTPRAPLRAREAEFYFHWPFHTYFSIHSGVATVTKSGVNLCT